MSALATFLAGVAQASSVAALQRAYLDGIGEFIESAAAGVYVLEEAGGRPSTVAADGVSRFFLARYEELGRDRDPVLSAAVRAHDAVDNRQLMELPAWTELPVYDEVFALHRMDNLLQAPIMCGDQVRGTLNFARPGAEHPFTEAERERVAEIGRVLGIVLDGVRRREALQRERDGLEAALGLADAAVVVTDLGSAERRLNPAARRLLASLDGSRQTLDDLLSRAADAAGEPITVRRRDGTPASLAVQSTVPAHDPDTVVSVLELRCPRRPSLRDHAYGLTSREREVAELAVDGQRDREIAEALHLSPYTVKEYLKNTYAKVGVRSRVELARVVHSA